VTRAAVRMEVEKTGMRTGHRDAYKRPPESGLRTGTRAATVEQSEKH